MQKHCDTYAADGFLKHRPKVKKKVFYSYDRKIPKLVKIISLFFHQMISKSSAADSFWVGKGSAVALQSINDSNLI